MPPLEGGGKPPAPSLRVPLATKRDETKRKGQEALGTQSTSHPQNHDPTCAILAQMGNQSGRLACKLPTIEHTLTHADVRTHLGLSEDRGAPLPLRGMSRSPKTRFSSTRWLENQQASAPPTPPQPWLRAFSKRKRKFPSCFVAFVPPSLSLGGPDVASKVTQEAWLVLAARRVCPMRALVSFSRENQHAGHARPRAVPACVVNWAPQSPSLSLDSTRRSRPRGGSRPGRCSRPRILTTGPHLRHARPVGKAYLGL